MSALNRAAEAAGWLWVCQEVRFGEVARAVFESIDTDDLARAVYREGAFCGDCDFEGWDSCSDCRRVARIYAEAVKAHLLAGDR